MTFWFCGSCHKTWHSYIISPDSVKNAMVKGKRKRQYLAYLYLAVAHDGLLPYRAGCKYRRLGRVDYRRCENPAYRAHVGHRERAALRFRDVKFPAPYLFRQLLYLLCRLQYALYLSPFYVRDDEPVARVHREPYVVIFL